MIAASKLQNAYIDLYTCMRNYIWDFDTVSALADLETETYQAFPDIQSLNQKFTTLKQLVSCSDVFREDDDLKNVFDEYQEILSDDIEFYAGLKSYKEVVIV